jgi:hypothetical protein
MVRNHAALRNVFVSERASESTGGGDGGGDERSAPTLARSESWPLLRQSPKSYRSSWRMPLAAASHPLALVLRDLPLKGQRAADRNQTRAAQSIPSGGQPAV